MRVAIVGPYPIDTQKLVGIEVAIVYLQQHLLQMPDVELHVLTCKEELAEPREMRQERLTVTYLPRGRWGRITWHRREVQAMLSKLREIEPDVVHSHGTGLYAGAALASPYPAIVTVHAIARHEARLVNTLSGKLRGSLDAAYESYVMRRAKHLMAISPYVERVFAREFSGRSYLVENACDESFFAVQRQPVTGRILMAGPVKVRKGILPLLKAMRLVLQEAPEAHLRIAGSTTIEAEYAQACQAYVREAGLGDAVTFLGHLPQEQVLEEYARCAMVVLPSFEETAPMVIEQAMVVGAPSVSTLAGGVPWMLEEGVTGLTLPVPPTLEGDPPALAAALLRLLRNPQEAEQMGRRAKEVAEKLFRAKHIAQQTYEVYQQVIEASR